MDCFQDFCLYCDRDSPADGAYCSQRCKLADLQRSHPSSPSSPSSPTSATSPPDRSWTPSTPADAAPSPTARPRSSCLWAQQLQQSGARPLTPSSSRTSLSSTSSSSHTTTAGSYSNEAKAQLNNYFSSFDQAKAAKRRSSTR